MMKSLSLFLFFILISGQKTSSFSSFQSTSKTRTNKRIRTFHSILHLKLSIQQQQQQQQPTPDDERNKENIEDDDNISIGSSESLKSTKTNKETPPPPPPSSSPSKSRLALLAEDWLEDDDDDEEDELQKYWERFDEKTPHQSKTSTIITNKQDDDDDNDDSSSLLTTEERLERYLDSRGIRRKEEILHQKEIENAIQIAQKATTPEEAIQALDAVQPYLQVHTRLGGTALVEYLIATWQKNEGYLDEELCRALLNNPHDIVVSKVKQLLKRKEPPTRQPSLWSGLFSSKDNTNGWSW